MEIACERSRARFEVSRINEVTSHGAPTMSKVSRANRRRFLRSLAG